LLATLGYHGMTIAEVTGMGRRERFPINWMSKGLGVLPKLKIELVVNDDDVSQVLSAIVKGAKTGEIGDGRIFVIPIEDVIRVSTGDSGINAV